MSEDLRTENSVRIEGPVEKVWEALTTAEMRKQWFVGVDTETDWKAGSPIIHRAEYQGKTYEDRGIILEIEPPRPLGALPLESRLRTPGQAGEPRAGRLGALRE